MEKYIIEGLDSLSEKFKSLSIKRKQRYVTDVIDSYVALTSCRSFDDLRQYIADVFEYRYVRSDGSIISFKLNSRHNSGWTVSKPQHQHLAMINSKVILTLDSIHATSKNKAGMIGLIEGKHLVSLQEFILRHPNVFTMTSIKMVTDPREHEVLVNLLEKYEYKGPYYSDDFSYADGEWIRQPGYRDFYHGQSMFNFSFDAVITLLLSPDYTLSRELKIDYQHFLDTIRRDFVSRDLHVVSFLGNKLNDNSLFSVMAKFNATDDR